MGSQMKKLFLFFLLLNLLIIVGCSCETNTASDKKVTESTTKQVITSKTTPQSYTVLIESNKFKPSVLEIRVGDTVTWINKDSAKHTITFEDVRVNQILTKGAQVSYTFKEKEEARYFCKFHPGMQGSVVVS